MRIKQIIKIIVDAAMFVLFLLLMEEHLIPDGTHEWLGISLFVLFIAHNVLNYKWYKVLFKGRYNAVRIVQTMVNALLMIAMICCIASSIMISGTVFAWMGLRGAEAGRQLHMITTSWSFVLMSVHLGLHFAQFVAMGRKVKLPEVAKVVIKWALRVIFLGIGIYGIIVFVQRSFYEELFLLTMFKNFDYEKNAFVYMLETLSMSIIFISIAYYAKKLGLTIKKIRKEKQNEKDT